MKDLAYRLPSGSFDIFDSDLAVIVHAEVEIDLCMDIVCCEVTSITAVTRGGGCIEFLKLLDSLGVRELAGFMMELYQESKERKYIERRMSFR